ncbi:MAG: glycosyltransferase [Kiritimatiellae bacterium]|nr:glycosyltransferase [Kiritimatiellia bacterium]MDD5521809.1 glycosyltransferase [Kiritimatiellia bacterium]
MRILNLIPQLSCGGAERQLSYLAPELVRMGHDVHIAYCGQGPQKPELPGVLLHQIKARSNYDPCLLWKIIRLTRFIKPDIIHTWILQMDVLGGIAARLKGIPWIFREPSSAMAYPPTWKNRLRVRVGSGASDIVSNSRGGDAYWKTQLPYSRRYVIPNGLPLHEIDRTVAALPLGLAKTEVPIVLYVGRLTSDVSATKNLTAFLESLVYVKQQQRVQVVLCGKGPQRAELELLRHKLGLAADVHFTGYLPVAAVWALMKKASVFVSLSAYEGCPNTVMEAMACGCPLVVSDIPAHHEILDESCARFVDPSNIQQTADAVVQTLCNADISKGHALSAKQKTQEWSVAKMARDYEKIYKELV